MTQSAPTPDATSIAGMKTLGIIGGMGPEATVEFMMRLLRATYAEDDQDHIPVIADNNSQVPSRISWLLENKGEDPVPEILRTTRRLCDAGVDFLVMPCNTTHAFAPQIIKAATVPFLHAIEIAAGAVTKTGAQQVGILGSPAMERTAIYEAPLAALNATAVYPTDQARLLSAIREAKAKGPTPLAQEIVGQMAQELAQKGVDVILVACTEFSLMQDVIAQKSGLPTVDALDALVDAAHRFATDTKTAS